MRWKCQPEKGDPFYREWGFSLCNKAVLWNVIVTLTGYSKRFYRILLFTILLLLYQFYLYWDWQAQNWNLKCPKVSEINTELKCLCWNFFLHPSLRYKHLYLPTVTQEYIYCNWKYISEWSFFEIKHFSIYA